MDAAAAAAVAVAVAAEALFAPSFWHVRTAGLDKQKPLTKQKNDFWGCSKIGQWKKRRHICYTGCV